MLSSVTKHRHILSGLNTGAPVSGLTIGQNLAHSPLTTATVSTGFLQKSKSSQLQTMTEKLHQVRAEEGL